MLAAVLIDAVLGDPPSRFHPVAWMGTWIGLIRRRAPQGSALASFVYGAASVMGSASLLGVLGVLLSRAVRHWGVGWLVEGAVVSQLIAGRGLIRAGEAVARPLEAGDLGEARRQLGWHLVSRDVSRLDEGLVAAGTIESLAENSSDSVIAPLVWYGVGGLPASLVYRFVNTADAMLGYRDAEREWLGKGAARTDDLLNLIPSRLTALLIVAGAAVGCGDAGRAWRIWRRDGGKTASPNAGQPMSAAAGALGVELEKVGQYRLGEGLEKPRAHDIRRAARLVTVSTIVGIAVGIAIGAAALVFGNGRSRRGSKGRLRKRGTEGGKDG